MRSYGSRGDRPDVSIVIPCYLEESHLEHSISEIDRVMGHEVWSYELLFVEDGSTDRTPEIIKDLILQHANRRAIFHEKNRGRGATVTEGIRAARGEVAGFIDIDLEVHARYIPEAVSHIFDLNYQVVVGRRDYRLQLSPSFLLRHFLSMNYRRWCHWALPVPVTDSEAGLKFFRQVDILPVLEQVRSHGWFWDTEVVARAHRAGLRVGEFDCLFVRRQDKRSTVRVFRDSLQYFRALRKFCRELRQEGESHVP